MIIPFGEMPTVMIKTSGEWNELYEEYCECLSITKSITADKIITISPRYNFLLKIS